MRLTNNKYDIVYSKSALPASAFTRMNSVSTEL